MTKEERIRRHERVLARRLRQLRAVRSAVSTPRTLLDHGALGRCGHKRCMCHLRDKHTYREKKYERETARIIGEALARPPQVNEVLLEAFRENRDLLDW